MPNDKLIYASSARKAILKEYPKLAYCIDSIPGVDAVPLEKYNELKKRIAELESQVVRMQYRDDIITQKRVFEIRYSDLLNPEEAMDIFVRNIQRILKGERENDL